MTNQEINVAVARKLGYWRNEIISEHVSYTKGPNTIAPTPDFCTSIAATWEIVEKGFDEYEFILTAHYWQDGNKFWECDMNGTKAEADTAPMAICLAFLKLNP